MKMFEEPIAVEETADHDGDADYGVERTTLIVDELADEQSANRVVGQSADFIRSPAALIRGEHRSVGD